MRPVLAVILLGLPAGIALFAFELYLPSAIVVLATTIASMMLAMRS